MRNRRTPRRCFLQVVFPATVGCLVAAAHAKDIEVGPAPSRAWVSEPSPSLAAKFQHWRLKLTPGEAPSVPEKGIFSSWLITQEPITVRVVSDLNPPPAIRLIPIAKRTSYARAGTYLGARDKVITKELMDALRSPEVVDFLVERRLDSAQLRLERNLAAALVQDFEVALRSPGTKEHVWSINWRLEHRTESAYVGYEAWGLFTRVSGGLKPFYLEARRTDPEVPMASYYYALAVGDLDGDGIDEMVVRGRGFEQEEDILEIWTWERDSPVRIHRIIPGSE
jgi:hypothetical protein